MIHTSKLNVSRRNFSKFNPFEYYSMSQAMKDKVQAQINSQHEEISKLPEEELKKIRIKAMARQI